MSRPETTTPAAPHRTGHPSTDCKGCNLCAGSCELLGADETPRELFGRADLTELAYRCSLCGLCDRLCPLGLDVSGAFRAERERAVGENRHTPRAWLGRRLFEWLGRHGPLQAIIAQPGTDTLLFPGCNLSGMRPAAVDRLWRTLREKDPKLGLLFDCCGIISRDMGDREGFSRATRRLRSELSRCNIRKLVIACPSCYKTLREALTELELSTAVEALRDIPLPAPSPGETNELVLHDPCSARADAAYMESVRALGERSGLALVRPERSGETTWCCADAAWNVDEPGRPVLTSCAGCMQTISRRTPARHLFDFLFDTGEATVPSLLLQLCNRWRLLRRVKRAAKRPLQP